MIMIIVLIIITIKSDTKAMEDVVLQPRETIWLRETTQTVVWVYNALQ